MVNNFFVQIGYNTDSKQNSRIPSGVHTVVIIQ